MTAVALPDRIRGYLAHPSLTPVWARVRTKLERGGLSATGTVVCDLDEDAADRLSRLIGGSRTLAPGRARLKLDELDRALRNSAAAAGLVSVLTELTGQLVDRTVAREQREVAWSQVWGALDAGLADAGLAAAPWVPAFADALRGSGLLTRAGAAAATEAVGLASAVLAQLADGSVLTDGSRDPDPRWELAALAGVTTHDAHGLDDGRLAAALVLRAAAAATGEPVPSTPAEQRVLWEALGVTPDQVSGTVLVWGLRPPGSGRWAAMMRERAELGLATHLTVRELRAMKGVPAAGGQRVHACENPQVLQAAARAGVPGPLICFGGNPAAAGLLLLQRILAADAWVGYHGDFDWPGIRIAARLLSRGAAPWRMAASDYENAARDLPSISRLALSGRPAATGWDERLSAAMLWHGIAVHEEALLPSLLGDLA